MTATNATGDGDTSRPSNPVTPFTTAPQLLADPGFETGNGGWAPFIVGTFSRTSATVRSGNSALSIASPLPTATYVGMTHNTVVTNSVAGRQYTLSAMCDRPTQDAPSPSASWSTPRTSPPTSRSGTTTVNNLSTAAWTPVTVTGTATASGRRVILQIYSTNQTSTTGTIAYDDCSVVAAPISPPSVASRPDSDDRRTASGAGWIGCQRKPAEQRSPTIGSRSAR